MDVRFESGATWGNWTRKSLGILEGIALLGISWPMHQIPLLCTLETFRFALLTTYELRLKTVRTDSCSTKPLHQRSCWANNKLHDDA